MTTKRRQSKAAAEELGSSESFTWNLVLPDDVEEESLTNILPDTDFTTITPEDVFGLYRLLIMQSLTLENSERERDEALAEFLRKSMPPSTEPVLDSSSSCVFVSRPLKRSRSETTDPIAQKQQALRSTNFWLKDGNIVLLAEQTLFRIHGALLARHSKIFEEMFNVAQPDESMESVVGCCPVIPLSDSALDVEQLLFIFYDNVKALDKRDILFSMAAAMIRLGKKYQIDYLYEAAKSAFRKDYPIALDDWDPVVAVIQSARRGDMISLAHEMSLKTVLPSLYLDFISAYSLSDILRNGETIDEPRLPLDIRETLIVGRDRLICYLQEQQRLHLKRILSSGFCQASLNCHGKRITFFEGFSLWQLHDGSPYNLRPWDEKKHLNLCTLCTKQMRDTFNEVRADAWAKLPMFFGLGKWETLEDETP